MRRVLPVQSGEDADGSAKCNITDLEFPDRWGLMRGIGFFDGPCQVKGCECTPAGYIPGDGRSYAEVAP